jgi:hypothetical protein
LDRIAAARRGKNRALRYECGQRKKDVGEVARREKSRRVFIFQCLRD